MSSNGSSLKVTVLLKISVFIAIQLMSKPAKFILIRLLSEHCDVEFEGPEPIFLSVYLYLSSICLSISEFKNG